MSLGGVARGAFRATLALVVFGGWACVSAPASRRDGPPGGPEPPAGEQSLYRLTYDGGEGRTTLKVVLRRAATGRFQMVLSDLAGRRVWALDYRPDRSLLVDYRAATYCVSGSDLRLPEVHPAELPLAAIPRVLAGALPVEGTPDPDGELVDAAGRRWRASYREEVLESWSLFDELGPSLWWQADRGGGILSQRGGVQYRWSLVVREPARDPLGDLVPPGFSREPCDG